MRAMGKWLLEVFKDKDTVNATLREHIETIESYFRKYDSVQLLGSIGLYLLDNLPNLEKCFMAQMNGTEIHLDENAEVIAEYAMNFGLSMPNDGIDNPTDEVVKDLRNRLRVLFMTYIYQDMPLVDDPMQSIDWMIHMDTIVVRGDGYQNHVYEVFKENVLSLIQPFTNNNLDIVLPNYLNSLWIWEIELYARLLVKRISMV